MAEPRPSCRDFGEASLTLPGIAANREAAQAVIGVHRLPSGPNTVQLLARAVVTASETFVDELMIQLHARGYRRVSVRGADEVLFSALDRAATKHGLRLLANEPAREDEPAEAHDDLVPPQTPLTATATVFDVAEYILEQYGEMTAMKLQKLVYYCQAWHLAWDGEPLFRESIEAWANGPVVPALYEAHRGVFRVGPGFFRTALQDPEIRARVDARLEQDYTGRDRELRARIEATTALAEQLLTRAGPLLPDRLLALVALGEHLQHRTDGIIDGPMAPERLTVEILDDLGVTAGGTEPVRPGAVRARLEEIKREGRAETAEEESRG